MAIDTDTAKDSLFGNIKKQGERKELEHQERPPSLPTAPPDEPSGREKGERALAKWERLQKVTVLLTDEQKEGLDKIAKRMMRLRSKAGAAGGERERITANTVLRSLIENFLERESSLNQDAIFDNEEDVKKWMRRLFR